VRCEVLRLSREDHRRCLWCPIPALPFFLEAFASRLLICVASFLQECTAPEAPGLRRGLEESRKGIREKAWHSVIGVQGRVFIEDLLCGVAACSAQARRLAGVIGTGCSRVPLIPIEVRSKCAK
jgi:hypothetical protein